VPAFAADIRLEEVAMALLITVKDQLPGNLAAVASEMATQDAEWTVELSDLISAGQITLPATPLDAPASYWPGDHPRLLDLDTTQYPCLIAMAYDHASDSTDNAVDQIEELVNTAYVEMAVLDTDEVVCNRKAWRSAKALHRTILHDPTLGGVVEEIKRSPNVSIGQVSARRATGNVDTVEFVQPLRLDYRFRVPEPW
jgi:hypothetical protein